jgi:lysozyme family protein
VDPQTEKEGSTVPLTLTLGLSKEYQRLYESCLIPSADRLADADAIVAKLRAAKRRYEAVAKPLNAPWFVVGLIHNMESGLNFSTHLHNGDPLTARTKNEPPGRPARGTPPFSWEESATDALTMKGFQRWKNWNVPGILYKLEQYNGWGYRDHHPDVLSPYLWSFSNHYKRGKYVADGTFSPTAVSQQCGAAVLLKRLREGGIVRVVTGPRVLQLANPNMVGPDVEEAQRLLKSNQFGVFDPGDIDGEFGQNTAGAVKRAKWELGYPAGRINGSFGPKLKAYLLGTKPLPAAYQKERQKRLEQAVSQKAVRDRIVKLALWGVKNSAKISYTQGAARLEALLAPEALPLATDCSAFATLCYSWAQAPNPNAAGAFSPRQTAFTGTMLSHCRHIPRSAVQRGDLVVWSPPDVGHHVCVVVQTGADPMLVSHGSDSGPLKIRFSEEDAAQRRNGHGKVTWLSAF